MEVQLGETVIWSLPRTWKKRKRKKKIEERKGEGKRERISLIVYKYKEDGYDRNDIVCKGWMDRYKHWMGKTAVVVACSAPWKMSCKNKFARIG